MEAKTKTVHPPRVTDEYIHEFVTSKRCKVVQIERIRGKSGIIKIYLRYICNCSDKVNRNTWSRFVRDPHCANCKNADKNAVKRDQKVVEHEQMKTFIEANGCKLIEIYTSFGRNCVKYICKCDDGSNVINSKKYSEFLLTPKCRACIFEENSRVTDVEITKILASQGHTYISHTPYKEGVTRFVVKYLCSCGSTEPTTTKWPTIKKCCKNCRTDIIKKGNLEKYGVEFTFSLPEVKKKSRETCLKKYGAESASSTDAVKQKTKETTLARYGVEHIMHCSEFRDKQARAAFKLKEYIFPSGRIVTCQGYEPKAFERLMKDMVHEDDILSENDISANANIPQFWYVMENKRKRYYPDIFIISKQLFIEVKSTYTIKCDIEKNKLKRQSVIDAGYKYEVWVFTDAGQLTILI